MKKIFYFAAVLFLTVNCGGKGESTVDTEGAVPQTDTTEMEAPATADSPKQIQQEDTITNAVKEEAVKEETGTAKGTAAIPSFYEIEKSKNVDKLFKNRGFKVSKKREYVDRYDDNFTFVTATYDSGDGISCKYVEDLYGFKFTVKGAPEILDKFQRDAKAWIKSEIRKNPGDAWVERMSATKSGNTVTVFYGGD